MVYALILLCILLSLIYKRSKPLFAVEMIFIWILLGFSSDNADYLIHLSRFLNYKNAAASTEILYTKLMAFGNLLGLTYDQFLPILMGVYCIILAYVILKNSKAPCFVVAMYLIFPACMEAVQVRYTLAASLALLGITFLLNREDKYAELKFSICIAIGSLMHISVIVCFVYLGLRRLSYRKTFTALVVMIAFVWISRMDIFVNLLGRLPGMDVKIAKVLASAAGRYSTAALLNATFRVMIYYAVFQLLFVFLKKKLIQSGQLLDAEQITEIEKLNLLCLIVLPLIAYSADFYRIQQSLTLINYCAISLYWGLPEPKAFKARGKITTTRSSLMLQAGTIGGSIINLYLLVLNSNNINTVFIPFMEHNRLFGGG